MYSITAHLQTLQEAKERFRGIVDFDAPQQENADDSLPGMEVWLPSPHETDPTSIHTLFVRVPGADRTALRKLGSREITQINWPSENLLHQQSFAIFGPQLGGIYVPLWGARSLMLHGDVRTVRLVLVGDEHVLDARHHFTDEDLEQFILGCQAQMDSSGPHYSPLRHYDEEQLNEVAGRGDAFAVTGRMVRLFES